METLPTPPVLQLDGLNFSYPLHTLFTGLSVHIPPGVTLLLGGDSSGKTTLLRLLAGTLPADAGQFHIHGVGLKPSSSAYRQQVFWADPRSDAFEQINALTYFESVRPHYPGFDESLLQHVIEGLSLTPFLEKPLYMLSTGSKRKVWLAAAFASGAAVTLLDDPFAALDKPSIRFILELLEDAADHTSRAWVVAAYEAPGKVPLAAIIELADRP